MMMEVIVIGDGGDNDCDDCTHVLILCVAVLPALVLLRRSARELNESGWLGVGQGQGIDNGGQMPDGW